MSKRKLSTRSEMTARPDIFRYHDFRSFLKDWLDYSKDKDPEFSLRALARKAETAPSTISMILKGERPLSLKLLLKLLPLLNLNPSEESYFENLVKLGTEVSQDAKASALDRMSKYTGYQKKNPQEARFFQYYSHWQHVAIREMAQLKDFKLDAEWIQERLNQKIPLNIIRDALAFLTSNGFLTQNPDGTVSSSGEALQCIDEIFWAAQTQFHREMFNLATASIENTPAEKRNLEGLTFAVDEERYKKINEILKRSLDEIEAVVNSSETKASSNPEAIYQVEVALFPITQWRKKSA